MKNPLFLLLLLLIIISVSSASAQSWLKQASVNSPDKSKLNFYDIQKAFNEYWGKKSGNEKDKEEDKDGEWQQFKRWEWSAEQRVFPSGNFFDPEILVKEYSKYKNEHPIEKSLRERAANWTFIGPHTVPSNGGAGRINCMAFDPNNSNIIYIGAASGGLWKSMDGGNTWSSNTDLLPALSISDIAMNPLNTNVMYLVTGDKDGYIGSSPWFWGGNYSAGLVKSIDAGATWSLTSLNFAQSQAQILQRVIINPQNPNIIIVASNSGIYRSDDDGTTWENVQAGDFYDLEFNTSNPNIVYASDNSSVYRSNDAGITWNPLSANLCTGGRNFIAITPANSNVLYAWCANGNFFKSTDGGNTFNLMGSPNLTASPIGSYVMVLEVSPLNPDVIFTGGVNIAKSTDGGSSWASPPTNYVHGDHHYIKFLPGSGSTVFSCNDGGIFKTTDGGGIWYDLSNGLDIKQYYRIACSALDPNLIYGGAQDNGTDRFNGLIAESVSWGDGMECLVDYTDNNIVYTSYQFGNFSKSTDGGNTFNDITPAGTLYMGNWTVPMVMHPSNSQILYAGYNNVYKSTDGGNSWNTISTDNFGGRLYTLAVSSSNPDYIYVATYGNIFRTNNGGTSWNTITQNLPVNNAAIIGIAISSSNPDHVWVTFSGYSNGNKVFNTTDGGATWINSSGTLPNIPVNCIVYQTGSLDGLYIGSDFGVYYRNATMNDWVYYNTGLPNVIISELEIQYSASKLRAATYGRGIWESDLATPTGIEQLNDDSSISIYPNPAFDQLTISGLQITIGEKINAEIYNTIGQKIFDVPITKNKIDIRNIKPGIYVIKITTSNGTIAREFIKK